MLDIFYLAKQGKSTTFTVNHDFGSIDPKSPALIYAIGEFAEFLYYDAVIIGELADLESEPCESCAKNPAWA
jgi:hypothetical protein